MQRRALVIAALIGLAASTKAASPPLAETVRAHVRDYDGQPVTASDWASPPWTPVLRQHAANENLRLQNLWDGIAVFASVLTGLGSGW
jgi:hypothetical protein